MIKLCDNGSGIPLGFYRLKQMLGEKVLHLPFIIKGDTFHTNTPVLRPLRDRSSARMTIIRVSKSNESPQVKNAGGFNIKLVKRASSVMSSRRVNSPYSSSKIGSSIRLITERALYKKIQTNHTRITRRSNL